MGTRHLTIIKVDGKVKVAQYGQWDGYPTGQGETISKFLDRGLQLDRLKFRVRELKWVKQKDLIKTWTECGADPESDFVSMVIAEKHRKLYPEFSRDTCAGIIELIQNSSSIKYVKNDLPYLKSKDGFNCEYAYELDLDKETVTVYVDGNNKFGTYSFDEFSKKGFTKKLEKEISKRNE